jgi:hypothetical protein
MHCSIINSDNNKSKYQNLSQKKNQDLTITIVKVTRLILDISSNHEGLFTLAVNGFLHAT